MNLRRHIQKLAALLLAAAICSAALVAQNRSKLGGEPGAATRIGFGAVGIGMGNAVSAVRSQYIVGYYNPALTPYQVNHVGAASVGLLSLDRTLNYLSYTQPLKPTAGLSVAFMNAGVSDIEGRDRDGNKTETYSTSENMLMLSFGIRVSPKISLGVAPKIYYYSLYKDLVSTTVGFDIGAAYALSERITLGLVFQDIGSKYKWDTSNLYGLEGNVRDEDFPVRYRIASSYANPDWGLVGSAELEAIGETILARFGAELEIVPTFAVRAGLDQLSISDELVPKASFGFTLTYALESWTPALHYAFVFEPYVQSGIHMISVSGTF